MTESSSIMRELAHGVVAEKIQRKYPRKRRYVKGIREAIRKHGRRVKECPSRFRDDKVLIEGCM